MANTMTLISSVTVGSGGAASIDFTSIPSTYTDLCVLGSIRLSGNGSTGLRINSDTGNNYQLKNLRGTGSSALSGGGTLSDIPFTVCQATDTANTFGNFSIYIPNYAGSTQKSISVDAVSENNATAATASLSAGLWTGTSAITALSLSYDHSGPSATVLQYSTAYLYGVKNA